MFLVAPDKEDHANSPAFTVALNQAIGKLGGTAYRVAAAATLINNRVPTRGCSRSRRLHRFTYETYDQQEQRA